MTVTVVGTIVEHKAGVLLVKDATNKEIFELYPASEDVYELEDNTSGIFIGELNRGQIKVRHYALRRLLDPMYEDDLLGIAGDIVQEIMNDPFPAIFEEQMRIKLEREQEENT